jgi:hypothetical protein
VLTRVNTSSRLVLSWDLKLRLITEYYVVQGSFKFAKALVASISALVSKLYYKKSNWSVDIISETVYHVTYIYKRCLFIMHQ